MNEDELILEGGEQMEMSMGDMTPEEAKAALGLSTRLAEQFMMPQQPMEGDMGAEMAQGEELELETPEAPEADTEAIKGEIMQEVKSILKEEIGGLKDMIKSALKDDEEE